VRRKDCLNRVVPARLQLSEVRTPRKLVFKSLWFPISFLRDQRTQERGSEIMSATSTGRKAPNAIDVHIGQKIRARRVHLGMSQGTLADALGLTFQQVQKYEKGVNRVGGSRLQHISDALGVSPSHFFNGAPTVGNKAPAPNEGELSQLEINSFLATRDGALLVRSYLAIEQKPLRQAVIDLMRTVAKK
jgi:transcriptional regulator with XRE-family HTH domain